MLINLYLIGSYSVRERHVTTHDQQPWHHWHVEAVEGAAWSLGWSKIECFLRGCSLWRVLEAAHSQLRGPPAAKSDLVRGNIFSPRLCLWFRRPGHMLWNEVGRQTKRVVICPHCVAIDLLLLAAALPEGTVSAKKRVDKKKWEKQILSVQNHISFNWSIAQSEMNGQIMKGNSSNFTFDFPLHLYLTVSMIL